MYIRIYIHMYTYIYIYYLSMGPSNSEMASWRPRQLRWYFREKRVLFTIPSGRRSAACNCLCYPGILFVSREWEAKWNQLLHFLRTLVRMPLSQTVSVLGTSAPHSHRLPVLLRAEIQDMCGEGTICMSVIWQLNWEGKLNHICLSQNCRV